MQATDAGSDGTFMESDAGPDAAGPDVTPDAGDADVDPGAPTLVSVAPADGAAGVEAEVKLVFTFDRPMDPVATQAAFQSDDVMGTFAWSGDHTVLTVQPSMPLAYATGTSVDGTVARRYAYALGNIAKDVEGRAFAGMTGAFTTYRRITQSFGIAGSPRQTNIGNVVDSYCYDDNPNNVGISGYGDKFAAAQLQFDLTTLPEGAELEAATLEVEQVTSEGNPFAVSQLGTLNLQHVFLGTDYAYNAVTTGVLRDLGVFTTSASPGLRTKDVLVAVMDDVAERAARENLSQYRIVFQNVYTPETPINAWLRFACRDSSGGAPEKLAVTYLLP